VHEKELKKLDDEESQGFCCWLWWYYGWNSGTGSKKVPRFQLGSSKKDELNGRM